MYDADDTFEPDPTNDLGHPAACSCPECRPDLAEGLPALISTTLLRAGVPHSVELTGPTVLVSLRYATDADLAGHVLVLRGYDVASDGERGLRVGYRGAWLAKGRVGRAIEVAA